ncbi:LacI family DNA-binding transcriptional regulator [Brevibacterium litoralis]|uniref:LacI family DNA-binding transcriptional regulator n=1 Tax=Brevibacterium litoralis TaxID=3138935 RepID=UPI0032EE63D1
MAVRSGTAVRSGAAVRMEDVAEAAGVSVTTVSRVLGGRQKVAASTRRRVLEALEATGYSRSTLLHGEASHLVAVCPPPSPEHWQIEVVRAVCVQLQELGLLTATPFLDPGLRDLRATVAAGASAVVTPTFTPIDVDVPVVRFAESTLEEVPLRPTDGKRVGAEWVAARVDLTGGLTLAFDHLSQLGHRRIGLICLDSGDLAAALRERFLAEHPARSFTDPDRLQRWIAPVPKSFSGGISAAATLRDATCTAVIVQAGLQLYGVLAEVRRRRLVVPRDLSVVGFGDSSTMRYTDPPATVLGLEKSGMVDALTAAVRTVLDLPGDRMKAVPPTFRPWLTARSSTAGVRQ